MLLNLKCSFLVGSSFYLTYWSSESTDREDHDNPMSNSTNLKYMGVFAAVSLGYYMYYYIFVSSAFYNNYVVIGVLKWNCRTRRSIIFTCPWDRLSSNTA